jgi:hemerythrin superfamily protein
MNTISKFIKDLEQKSLSGKSDVISLIEADHRKVDALFAQYQSSSKTADKRKLLEQIVKELNVHTAAEEKLVYPKLEETDEDGTNEAFEEHHVVEVVLNELSKVGKIDDLVDAKVKVLSELVKHHVKEEESKLLPELKQSGADLEELGTEFKNQKDALKAKNFRPGSANTNAKKFSSNVV